MNVLVINGYCLSVNSSANLCHLAYLQGLVDAGAHVSSLSIDPADYPADLSMEIPDEIDRHYIRAISLYERLSHFKKGMSSADEQNTEGTVATPSRQPDGLLQSIKSRIRALYGPYGMDKVFYQKCKRFSCDVSFDLVISISHPPVSHLAAYRLLKTSRIKAKHWIQIWEDLGILMCMASIVRSVYVGKKSGCCR